MLPSVACPTAAVDAAVAAHESRPTSRHLEHLADYSFRFDADAAPPPALLPRPAEGEAWPLALTLQEVRLGRARVVEGSRGLRVRHAHIVPGLAAAVERHAPTVRLWLRLGGPDADRGGWDDLTWLHAQWLEREFAPPRGPVALRPGVSVTDWPRFRASVADRLGAGPDAPCADGLRRDLADLFGRHAVLSPPAPAERLPARAA